MANYMRGLPPSWMRGKLTDWSCLCKSHRGAERRQTRQAKHGAFCFLSTFPVKQSLVMRSLWGRQLYLQRAYAVQSFRHFAMVSCVLTHKAFAHFNCHIRGIAGINMRQAVARSYNQSRCGGSNSMARSEERNELSHSPANP